MILIAIPIAWLAVTALIVAVCRAAAIGDVNPGTVAPELTVERPSRGHAGRASARPDTRLALPAGRLGELAL